MYICMYGVYFAYIYILLMIKIFRYVYSMRMIVFVFIFILMDLYYIINVCYIFLFTHMKRSI